jgi:hypothetical protein
MTEIKVKVAEIAMTGVKVATSRVIIEGDITRTDKCFKFQIGDQLLTGHCVNIVCDLTK